MEGLTVEYVPKSSPKSDEGESEESEEDLEEEPAENLEEEPEDEPQLLTRIPLQLSNHHNDDSDQVCEDPDEDPSEEYASEASSDTDTKETDHQSEAGHGNSSEKKRSLDAAAIKSTPQQVYHSQKKCRQDEIYKQESGGVSTVTDVPSQSLVSESARNDECACEQQENAGSSGKRRRSRWEPQCEQVGEASDGDRTGKKRKTRWTKDDAQLKMLGPIQLPDFMKDFLGNYLDPEIRELNLRLFNINRKLQGSELHYGSPNKERSPSPEPVYNNLGLRINTREVRLREKLVQERQLVISKLLEVSPSFKKPAGYKAPKLFKKLYVPVQEYPSYNFIGIIIGPRGNTIKRMIKETGAKILLRGKGSTNRNYDASWEEDLHVYIEADNQESLVAAVSMVEKLLIPVDEGANDHKRAQLEELAKLKHSSGGGMCSVCKVQGHMHYACPRQQSTLKTANACATCGSFFHPTSNCPSTVSQQISNSSSGSLGFGIGSTPNMKSIPNKEIRDTNLYVGSIPQTMDDTRLTELFSPFGKLTGARVIKDRTTGIGKGYGFVEFDDPIDAVLAVRHMNGYEIDGKMLAVRVAGPPAAASSSAIGLPLYSGPAAVPSTVPTQKGLLGPPGLTAVPSTVLSQTGLLGPPGLMLLGAQASFPRSEGLGLPSSSLYMGNSSYIPKSEALAFPAPVVSSLCVSKSLSSFHSSGKQSNQIQSLYPCSLKQFPGDPDYPGSGYQSYFATPGLMLPGADASFPKSEGLGLSPSPLYSGHYNHLPRSEAVNFTPPVGSSFSDSKSISGFHSSYDYSKRAQSPSPGSIEKFPGDPDYPSSQSQFYFTPPPPRSHFSHHR